ncbi:MAG: hbd2 [Deltaproteobacteria bacterium]|nr:hbd2 [Deltaproteobacteria bacterium]
MGHGIAQLGAQAMSNVVLCDISDTFLERAIKMIEASLAMLGKTSEECRVIINRIKRVTSIRDAVSSADLVIECLPENLELKKKVFKELDEICSPEVILATNTSGLSPTEIAQGVAYPERVIVAHFWNPPQLIPLVEVVPGERTSRNVVDTAVEWVKSLGKEPVRLKKECPGFIGNRLQLALLREALYIVEQGYADIEEVDRSIIYGHGRRLPVTGPILSADMGGLDIFNIISSYLFPVLCNTSEPSPLMQELVKKGDLGMKSGRGFYDFTPEMKEKIIKLRTETLLYFLEKDGSKS